MNFSFPYLFSVLANIPLGEGFGINTNIFETNIINLSAVIAIVISFVGQNLTSLLNDRKKTILNNLEEANQRALEAKDKLDQARNQLELAKKKAVEIREDGVLRASQELNNVEAQHKSRLDRLDEFKQETIQFYQQKSLKKATRHIISQVMIRVKERLSSGLDKISHVTVNNFYVSRFTEFLTVKL
jgi:F-type H+-transporting ATPase subunit b